MGKKKTKSHRQTFRQKYKIQKRVAAFKKKMKKAAKIGGSSFKQKKDPGIPNIAPMKATLLESILERKKRDKEELINRREAQRVVSKKRKAGSMLEEKTKTQSLLEERQRRKGASHSRAYLTELNEVIRLSDIIIEVLDARDPMSCRCKQIERKVLSLSGSNPDTREKKIILVLNKIDLVPLAVGSKWLNILRREYPTIAFKASTQSQRSNLGHIKRQKHISSSALTSSKCVGSDALVQLLKNYSRAAHTKTSITVGVVGFPNVGKSSVINSLKRYRAVGVNPTPGSTTSLQHVRLDDKVTLIDSPGVLLSNEESESSLLLRNCISIEKCAEPIDVARGIADKCPQEKLIEFYQIATFIDSEDFIRQVALRRNKLKKGGVPDLYQGALIILRDWVAGKIPFYALPSQYEEVEDKKTTVISHWGEAFPLDMEAINESNKNALLTSDNENESLLPYIQLQGGNFGETDLCINLEDENDVVKSNDDTATGSSYDLDEVKIRQVQNSVNSSLNKKVSKTISAEKLLNPTTIQDLKRAEKKARKRARRENTKEQKQDISPPAEEEYSFENDWVE